MGKVMAKWFVFSLLFFCMLISAAPLSAASQRIVSLAPNLTEIVYALGLGDELVGNTRQCDYPLAAKKVSKIGEMVAPNPELILKAQPTVVLATEGNKEDLLVKLKKTNIKVLEVSAKSASDLPEMIKKVGKELGRAQEGEKIAAEITSSLKKLLEKKDTRRGKKSRKFLLALQFNPVFSVTNQTWLGDLLSKTGLENIVPDGKIHYPQLAQEFVISANPDIIFIDPVAVSHEKFPEQAVIFNLEKLFARKTPLPVSIVFPADILARAGPRIVEGINFLLTNKELNSI